MMKKHIFGFCLVLGIFFYVIPAHAIYFADFAYQKMREGDVSAVRKYLEKGHTIDAVNSDGMTALCQAVDEGDYESYRKLRRLGANEKHRCMQVVDEQTAAEFAELYSPDVPYVSAKASGSGKITGSQYAAIGAVAAAAVGMGFVIADDDDDDKKSFSENNKCGEGEVWNGSACVSTSCGEGEIWDGVECVPEPLCPTGQRWNGSECIPINCPDNTHLVGNLCVADGNVVIEDSGDDPIYGVNSIEEDVFNIYSSPKAPDDSASILLKKDGSGNAYGVYGISNVFNSYVVGKIADGTVNPQGVGTGNISIEANGSGTAYGLYSKISDITQYKEAINASAWNEGTAYGNINITHQGDGASYGVFGDVRAYNAYAAYGGKSFGDITIHGDGDIYGVSGYVAATNAVSPFFGNRVVGNINLYQQGNGDVYGMMVNRDDIPGAGAGDGNTRSWFAFNAYSSGGGDDVEGNINIRNYGNGNAYGMYGGKELYNAMTWGGVNEETGQPNGVARGNINILNTGSGAAHGMYLPDADSNGMVANISRDGSQSVIHIVNAGNGNATGLRGGQETTIVNSGEIDINNLGSGTATGIYGEGGAFIRNGGSIKIIRQQYTDEETGITYTPTGVSAAIYGVYAKEGSLVENASAERRQELEGKVHLVQTTNEDVYGVYGDDVINAVARTGWDKEIRKVLDEEGNEVLDEEGHAQEETIFHHRDSKAFQTTDIVNFGNGNAYGIYSTGDVYSFMQSQEINSKSEMSALGEVSSEINLVNHNGGNAYGIYSTGGKIAHLNGENANSVINIANIGSGGAYGLYGKKGAHIVNSGVIDINNLGSGTAIGIYGEENSQIENSGTINIHRDTYTDSETGTTYNPTEATGGTAYGIYAEGGASVLNSGNITITGAAAGEGIHLADGATLENTGTVTFNGEVQNAEDSSSLVSPANSKVSVDLDKFGGEILLGKGGKFFAEELSGNLGVSKQAVLGSFDDEYVLDGALQAEKVDGVNVASKSAMFDSSIKADENGGHSVVLARKNFEKVLSDKSLAQFYEGNYEKHNNLALYDALKSAESEKALKQQAANLSGTDVLPNFRKENALVYRHLSRQFNDNLFNKPDENYIGGYKFIDISMDEDDTLSGSDGTANAAYGMLKGKADNGMTYGLGASVAHLESDYDSGASRKSNIFGLWAPVGYDFANGTQWYSKLYAGYADGSYDRLTKLGKYSADITEYQYGISNELRHKMSLGRGFSFEPLAELNLLGIYQDGFDEGKANGALRTDSGNSLSLEGGLGAYLTKEMIFNDDNKLGIQIGGVYYVEFLDPDDGVDTAMAGMSGKYKLKNKSQDDYAVFSVRANYTYKDLLLYAVLEKETGRNKAFTVDAGVQYKF